MATGVSLRPQKNMAPPRQRRRLSAPPAPSHLAALGFRLHHSTDVARPARTVDALDLSSASPTQTLASLRWLVLTYLESLETRLLGMAGIGVSNPTSSGQATAALPSAPTLEDARQWAKTALDMLSNIRSEVVSHFPSLNAQLPSAETGYLDVLAHVRTYLPDIELPQLPEWPQVPTMPQMIDEETLDNARTRFHDIDLEFHPKYIETLSTHLTTLREHLASVSFPFPTSPFNLSSTDFASWPTFASVAEGLEALVMEVRSKLEEGQEESDDGKLRPPTTRQRRKSIVALGSEYLSDVRDGFEANVEAMREQQEEMMETLGEQFEHMREGFDHMKENLAHMRENFNHELDIIGHELTAIRDGIGHELDVLKDEFEVMALEIKRAVQRSLHGVHLISYHDLPHDWKNNPFVVHGYRFIPIERWGLLVRSVFEFHNETLNIHTHLVPFLIWFSNLVFFNLSASYIHSLWASVKTTSAPYLDTIHQTLASHIPHTTALPPWLEFIASYTTSITLSIFSILSTCYYGITSFFASLPTPPFPLAITPLIEARGATKLLETSKMEDPIEYAFMSFALMCLFASAVWHTMSGCADKRSVEFCARCDYIGIGWLISATVATIVHYGFQDCHPTLSYCFLGLCLLTGVLGNIFPFMKWFNMHEYRLYRVAFFVAMAFSGLAPMALLGFLHSWREMYEFVCVIFPSLLSYIIGLVFYATHVPERFLPPNIRQKLDVIGGSSHAIWHCFIVLAVSQHKAAIALLKMGVQCRA
ncbi:hypothetical protein CC1G_03276 [Coprinopsis cinerea okayama7|uniref:HlyIII-domain-containing protein n=1 Tax=Coprinopsis cinerea (strain Okayama-7 / 130 / ATCC MYA-4618 / FGSC 9003) TaxID=240176 RepID=A8N7D3_COPC7|nr:hypothetical protein CC1G_03276 [Coprinopsis cinerea okayama7\|eukprot:XP_001830739.1 hypothetical protein CC1G_03276 [Coprinopsis cinerea okayama7\